MLSIVAAYGSRCARDAFVGVGGYRPPFAPAEDYDLWLRMAEHFQLSNLEQVVLKYRIHPHQVSIRKRAQQTRGVLAARVSASSRRSGIPDPMNSVREITPEGLTALGVTRSKQQSELATDVERWIRYMCMAGEYSVALRAALETCSLIWSTLIDGKSPIRISPWPGCIGDRTDCCSSLIAVARAVLIRPAIIGRPLKPLLRHVGLT